MEKVKQIVYTQANKRGLKGEFDNAKDAIKWAKENVYAFDYLKERKDTWEVLFEENLVWMDRGEVVECQSLKTVIQ